MSKKGKKSGTVIISLPIEMTKKIEQLRGDLPRSLVYRRLLERGLCGKNA